MQQNYDQKVNSFPGKIGDSVYVKREAKTNKLDSKSHGPYKIVDFLNKNNVIVETFESKRFQKHVDKLKLAYE